jgi:hypothetical protein
VVVEGCSAATDPEVVETVVGGKVVLVVGMEVDETRLDEVSDTARPARTTIPTATMHAATTTTTASVTIHARRGGIRF